MVCIDRPFSLQQGATCWFNSIMNGFVTSKYGQVIMYRALSKYIEENIQTKRAFEEFMNSELPHQDGRMYSKLNFYKWFYHWLVIGLPLSRNSRTIMRNIVPTKRLNTVNTHKNPSQGLSEILERMNITDFAAFDIHRGTILRSHPDPSFIVYAAINIEKSDPLGRFKTHLPATITQDGRVYRCDHMSIGVFFPMGAAHSSHAITGIRCLTDGSPMIIDSNSSEMYPCDWSSISNVANCIPYIEKCQTLYHSTPQNPIALFVIYTKMSLSVKNAMNISPDHILERYRNAMNAE